jgi:UDP-glucose 4-epimerase
MLETLKSLLVTKIVFTSTITDYAENHTKPINIKLAAKGAGTYNNHWAFKG